jgi:tetratricopeptide (TPR) repeat protein
MNRLAILSLFVPALAFAQPKTAEDFYNEGSTQYNLGNFKAAAEAFKKGFELEPDDSKKTSYLFNVAQSYRQDKDCEKQVFFYKRYLALKDNDAKKPLTPQKRQEVEGWISEGETCMQTQQSLSAKNPTGTTPPTDTSTENKPDPKTVAVVTPPTSDSGGDIHKSADGTEAPHLLSVRLLGGASKIKMGSDIDVPVQGLGTLLAGYPLALNDQLILDLGAGFAYTRVPFDRGSEKDHASLTSIFANVGATYLVTPKIGVRGDLGIGAMVLSGVDMSTFTDNNHASGGLAMFHLRVGASVDYAVTPNLIITVAPIAVGYSPAKTGLADSINSILTFDFMAGVGYRM